MTSTTDSLLAQMEKFKQDFLDTEGKNTFFKKSQKLDCAKKISQTFNLEDNVVLLQCGHYFKKDGFMVWARRSRSCPSCRANFR